MKSLTCFFLITLATSLHAGPRTSSSYRIVADSLDKGGAGSSSAAYSHSGSVGDVVGISTAPTATAKQGYLGQIYEITTLQLAAASASLNELATLQLSATPLLDDLTTLVLTPQEVAWSVQSGAFTSVDVNGLATAAAVYQTTAATAQGSYGGRTGLLNLSVLESIADNFDSYAGDRISDVWQVQYFGIDNPLGSPAADADYDRLNTFLEYATDTHPLALNTAPLTSSMAVPGSEMQLKFPYRTDVSDLHYIVQRSTDLKAPGGGWVEVYRYEADTGLSTETGVTAEKNSMTGIITITDPATGSAPSTAIFWRLGVE
jgi:hypothetical protein